MRKEILTNLLLSSILFATDSIYDGTGSLIHPLISINEMQKGLAWGADRDEAQMQPHLNKTSTVTFQALYDKEKCTHVDIHSEDMLEQDVLINLKAWDDDKIQESFIATLPASEYFNKDGVSLDISNYNWVTMSITTTKPIKEKMPIFAYCRNFTEEKNTNNIKQIETTMTKLNNNHYYMGNGSLISMLKTDNGQWGYGILKDEAVASNSEYNAETSFQIQGSKKCQKIRVSDLSGSKKVEEILYKGWDRKTWRKSNCTILPCELDTFFISEDRPNYLLVNVKTRKNENKHLSVECITKKVDINIQEKPIEHKNPNKCKFDDNITENQKYITAICSAEILNGDEESNYKKFKPDTNVTWAELTQTVELSYHFSKMKKIRNQYPKESIYQAYIDEAKKSGFEYPYDKEMPLGLAVKYIVNKFWKQDLNEEDAIKFIDKKINLTNSEPLSILERGYMSYIVLKSARVSSDENSVDRSLIYLNHDEKDLDINGDSDIPVSTFKDVTIETDDKERNNIIQKNIEEAIKTDSTLSENNETSNTSLAIEIIAGGEDGLKDEYQNKTSQEIFQEAEKNGIDTSIIIDIESTNKNTTTIELYQNENQENILIVSSTDEHGQNTKAIDNGEKVEKITENDLKAEGYIKIKEIKAQKLLVEPITLEVPNNLEATTKEYADKIKITWNSVTGVDKYYIYRNKNSSGKYEHIGSTSSESYMDKNVKLGQKYYYKVRSFQLSPSQLSEYSEYVDGETMEKIVTVSNLQATDKEFDDKIVLTWNSVEDASEYYIYRSPLVDDKYEEIAKTKLTSYNDINLDSNSTFYYKVKTFKSDRLSEYSYHDKGET